MIEPNTKMNEIIINNFLINNFKKEDINILNYGLSNTENSKMLFSKI